MPQKNNPNPLICQTTPWDNNSNPIWLASSVVLQRNIEKFKFPGKLDVDCKKQIIALISKKLLASEMLSKPALIKAEELDALEKEWLVEHFLCNHSYHQAGAGEAFIMDESGAFLASLNLFDHLHLQLVDHQGELENTWNRLVKIESALGKGLNYAFSPNFGFLTADPTLCGTALIVSVYLQLPGLIHTNQLDDILEKTVDESFLVTGVQGDPEEIFGDVIRIQNNYTLGITEENIISSLRSVVTKLIVEENNARKKIAKEESAEIKDRISRAYGILIHSYQIEAIEALNALSLLKLAADVHWLKGIDHQQLNQLFFNCRRAHLSCQSSEKISQEELPHKCAEMIHKSLKDVKLII